MQEGKKITPHGAGRAGSRAARTPEAIERSRALAAEALRGLALAGAAYLLGGCSLFFRTYPLGLALLCAAGAGVPFALPGLVASALLWAPYPSVYIGSYLIALLLRIITRVFIDTADGEAPSPASWLGWMRGRLFGESISLRMTAASVCAFIIGLYSVIAGGYRYYDLLGALFSIVVSPAAVWLLAGFFAGEGKGKSLSGRVHYLAGYAFLITALVYSARGIYIMGVSLAVFGAFFVTLALGRKFGILAGTAAGLLCGLAIDPLYAPVFVLAAIADGLLSPFSSFLAVSAALAAGMIWGLYIDGIGAISSLLPGLILSAALFGGMGGAGLLDASERRADKPAAAVSARREAALEASAVFAEKRRESTEQRLKAVSESFASLAGVFYNLSDRLRRPGVIDLRRICDKSFERACAGCLKRDICWGLEYGPTLDAVTALCSQLHERGRASPGGISEPVRRRCDKIESIIADINSDCAALTRAALSGEKISLFALDYEAMSRIINDVLEEQRADFDRSSDCEARAAAALEALGLKPEALLVWGGRRKSVCAKGIDAIGAGIEASSLRRALEEACGCRLEDPLIELAEDTLPGRVSVSLGSRRGYGVECATWKNPAEGDPEGVCGDSVCSFESSKDYFYALISDGMGTGNSAAFASGVSALFLEKMLAAGNRTKTSLKMLNGVLRMRGGTRDPECSATVDLLEIDLLTGEAALIKSGAAPTFVRRRGDIFKLHSKTLPIGILTALDAQQTRLALQDGDVIVMVSDGVSDAADRADDESEWLPELLAREWEDNLERMAKKIIGRAQSLGSHDDLSAVVLRVRGEG